MELPIQGIIGGSVLACAAAYMWMICAGRANIYRGIEKRARVMAVANEAYDRAKADQAAIEGLAIHKGETA